MAWASPSRCGRRRRAAPSGHRHCGRAGRRRWRRPDGPTQRPLPGGRAGQTVVLPEPDGPESSTQPQPARTCLHATEHPRGGLPASLSATSGNTRIDVFPASMPIDVFPPRRMASWILSRRKRCNAGRPTMNRRRTYGPAALGIIGVLASGLVAAGCGTVRGGALAPATSGHAARATGLAAVADSGITGCTALLSTHQVPAEGYPKIRAEFTGSRWTDLRDAWHSLRGPRCHLAACPGLRVPDRLVLPAAVVHLRPARLEQPPINDNQPMPDWHNRCLSRLSADKLTAESGTGPVSARQGPDSLRQDISRAVLSQ